MWMLASGGSAVCLGVAARLQSASQTRAPSSGVIIDFHLTGIRTFAELTTGQASCQNPGEAWTRKVSRDLQGLPGLGLVRRSCQTQTIQYT